MSTEEATKTNERTTDSVKEDEYKLHCIVDNSKAKVGISHYIAIAIWLGWFGFYSYLTLVLPLLWWYFPRVLTVIIAILTASALFTIERDKQPEWGRALGAWIMKSAETYFQMCFYCEDYEALKEAAPAILCIEPHDILPLSLFIFSDTLGYMGTKHKIRGCLTSACFSIPGMRHIYTWSDATDVNRATIYRLLDQKCTATLCPGGAHEVTYMTNPQSKELYLYLKSRMGIVKIAAEYGIPILPTFTFNQRSTYDYIVPQWPWLHSLGRKVGFIPLIFFGAGGIPFAQPKSSPLTVVVGKPIHVPKLGKDAPKEELEKYHKQFLDAYTRIFEKNKKRFGMGDITLKIV